MEKFSQRLWDSKRTKEYNSHCIGREDVLVINDEKATKNGYLRTKIIKSETKVPFTNLSVFVSALMHAQCLGDGPTDGFIIFSRSLNCGDSGCHFVEPKRLCQSNKNEIIVAVNILRPVPGRLDLTDLISISQLNASIVPSFLAFRIGIMAVEDFFKNLRKP